MSAVPATGRLRRIGVLVDERYRTHDGRVFAEDPYVRFLSGLRAHCDELVVFGRLFDRDVEPRYALPTDRVRFVPLPPYPRIGALLTAPRRWWPAISAALDAELPGLAGLWLNPGHPVSLLALHRASRWPELRCFGVLRGNYPAEARRHGHRLAAPVSGWVMGALLETFAWQARRRDVPCFACGPAEVAWLRQRGVRAAPMRDSLLTLHDLAAAPAADPALRSDVLAVGRLDPIKGLDVLLQAVAPLCRQRPDFVLRLVGDGSERPRLQAQAAALGIGSQVRFDGHVAHGPQLFARLRSTRVLALPSYMEGTPKAALEALAFGVPVVASAVGALPDLLAGPPPRGVLVPPGDAAALQSALGQLLADPVRHAALAQAARGALDELALEPLVARLVASIWPQPHEPPASADRP